MKKNTVIANRKKGDWEIIKKYFEDRGVDTNCFIGSNMECEKDETFYYGIIDGDDFENYTLKQAQQANATILEVSDIDKEFKVGDVVVGWFCDFINYNSKPWEIGEITNIAGIQHAKPKGYPEHATFLNSVRHATPEEKAIYYAQIEIDKALKNFSDTVTLPKSFVLEAHKSACSDWKKRIEEVVPELFPKNEIPEELQTLIKKLGKDKIIEILDSN